VRTHTDLGHDIHGTHDDLVKVTVFHQGSVLRQAILKACPDLAAQLSIHLQTITKVTHPDASQMIYLNTNINVQHNNSQLLQNISTVNLPLAVN